MEKHKERAIVTTSWDDGHPLDLRLAGILSALGMRGTFYVPIDYDAQPRMTLAELNALRSMNMEIGSHTVTHPRLTRVTDQVALREFRESKETLEQMLGEAVPSFCFPEGKFARRFQPLLRAAGYRLARTTVAFRTDSNFDPYAMPVTFQLWPHSRRVIARHALREGNLLGLSKWAGRWRGQTDLPALAESIVEHIQQNGGILHIWGHSWEIEQASLWPLLHEVMTRVANRPGVEYLTNRELLSRGSHA
jgi:peptidoglycan/xylan/chitin deacetylase (PgdA/CDA1 family)